MFLSSWLQKRKQASYAAKAARLRAEIAGLMAEADGWEKLAKQTAGAYPDICAIGARKKIAEKKAELGFLVSEAP